MLYRYFLNMLTFNRNIRTGFSFFSLLTIFQVRLEQNFQLYMYTSWLLMSEQSFNFQCSVILLFSIVSKLSYFKLYKNNIFKFLNLLPSHLLYNWLIFLKQGFHFLWFYFRKIIQVRQRLQIMSYMLFLRNVQILNYMHAREHVFMTNIQDCEHSSKKAKFTLYGGQFTFSTQLLTLNYLLYSPTDVAPQFS